MPRRNDMLKLAGTGDYFAMDIPHNTTWGTKSKSSAEARPGAGSNRGSGRNTGISYFVRSPSQLA